MNVRVCVEPDGGCDDDDDVLQGGALTLTSGGKCFVRIYLYACGLFKKKKKN